MKKVRAPLRFFGETMVEILNESFAENSGRLVPDTQASEEGASEYRPQDSAFRHKREPTQPPHWRAGAEVTLRLRPGVQLTVECLPA